MNKYTAQLEKKAKVLAEAINTGTGMQKQAVLPVLAIVAKALMLGYGAYAAHKAGKHGGIWSAYKGWAQDRARKGLSPLSAERQRRQAQHGYKAVTNLFDTIPAITGAVGLGGGKILSMLPYGISSTIGGWGSSATRAPQMYRYGDVMSQMNRYPNPYITPQAPKLTPGNVASMNPVIRRFNPSAAAIQSVKLQAPGSTMKQTANTSSAG